MQFFLVLQQLHVCGGSALARRLLRSALVTSLTSAQSHQHVHIPTQRERKRWAASFSLPQGHQVLPQDLLCTGPCSAPSDSSVNEKKTRSVPGSTLVLAGKVRNNISTYSVVCVPEGRESWGVVGEGPVCVGRAGCSIAVGRVGVIAGAESGSGGGRVGGACLSAQWGREEGSGGLCKVVLLFKMVAIW